MNWSWAYLATPAGCAIVLPWVIEGLKRIGGFSDMNKWWLRLIVYLSGLVIMNVAMLFIGWDWSQFALNFLYAVVVYFIATGEYHTIIKAFAKKEEE